ncbi:hypothetical protein BDF14DRAFT_1419878 [Spinellus fusiger]|nr:hypothetical protein BDF14DRAFT_1419878 [Spinellus fusiger]
MESTATATETEQDSSITEESFYLFGDKWIGPREDINTDTDASNPEIKTESTLFKRPLQKRVIPDMSPYSRPGRLKAAKKKFQKKSAKKVQSESRVNKYDLRSASHQNTIDYQQYKDLENSYDLETAGMGSDVSSASEYDPKQTKEPKKKNRRVSLEDSWNMDIEPLSEPSEYLNEPILEHKEKKKTVKFDSPKPSQYKKIREKQRTPFPETLRSSALMQGANTSVGPIVQSGKRRVGRPRKSDLLSQGIVAGQAILQSLLPQIQEKAPINADNPFSDDESHEPIFPIHHELPFEKKKMNVYAQLTEELELNTTVTPVNAFKPACQYNPFFLYNKAVRGSIYKMNPQLTTAQVSRLIAQQWKDLNPTEKEKYNQESADKRAQLKKARGYRGRNERFPPNGYVLFSKDCGAKLRKEQPHCTLQDVAKLASSQWKTMDPELKQQYNTTSATLRAKFVEENPDYVKARNEKLYMAVKKTVERKKVIRLLKKEMEEQENS